MPDSPYSQKPWLTNYDDYVPHELTYPQQPVQSLLTDAAQNAPNTTASVTSVELPLVGRVEHHLSYSELDTLSTQFAAGLQQLGVQKGDRVGLVSINCSQFLVAFFGILKAGAVAVAIDPTFPPEKLARQIRDTGISVLCSLSLFYDNVKAARQSAPLDTVIVSNIKTYFHPLARFLFTLTKEKAEGHAFTLQPGDVEYTQFLKQHEASAFEAPIIDPTRDTAIFQYTGGTTGTPKAAQCSHYALMANTQQILYWIPNQDDRFLAAIPFFHVYGLVAVMLATIARAAPMFMVFNPRDLTDVLKQIDAYHPTILVGVPALFGKLGTHPEVASGKYDLSSIRACISGSAPLPGEVKRRFEAVSGSVVMEGYGLSEAPTATHCNPMQGENRIGSIGLPFPDIECRIVDLDTNEDVPLGERGELLLRTPTMMTGYFQQADETDLVMDDGWLHTGDIATMDEDGYFYIVDRKKDIVFIGGFNVYPTQVEEVLLKHPSVNECAVAGIPHPKEGREGEQALKAWIVSDDFDQDALIEYCKEHLAYFEIPWRMEQVTELPRTMVGKVLRRELIEAEMKRQQAQL